MNTYGTYANIQAMADIAENDAIIAASMTRLPRKLDTAQNGVIARC